MSTAAAPQTISTEEARKLAADRARLAAEHADRAVTLMAEAEKELAGASPASVPPRAAHRVAMATALAMTSLALSTLVVPVLQAPPPQSG